MTTKRERKALAKKVRAAADYVDRVGLHKGGFNARGLSDVDAVATGVKCCTLGAVFGHVGRDVGSQIGLWDQIGVYLAETHPRAIRDGYVDGKPVASVPGWNDTKSRRKKDVVELLRGFADKLESGQ